MYTDEELGAAVKEGILSQDAVTNFRHFVASTKHTQQVDEENFRLITGFNDVFVVIASGLLLVSLAWLGSIFHPAVGAAGVAVGSWGLAEYFVRKRRMALPAIGLLLGFLGAVFALPVVWTTQPTEWSFVIAAGLTLVAARMHWQRFNVPITVAASTGALVAAGIASVMVLNPLNQAFMLPLLFAAGVICFALAMAWDISDPQRQTRRSDVAFWLHLLSAPLLVHPVFSGLGMLDGIASIGSSGLVVGLYIMLAALSMIVDRRAIMVSALVYVMYAFSNILQTYGMVNYSFALTGLCIGSSLLMLSAFWHPTRSWMMKALPSALSARLPHSQQA